MLCGFSISTCHNSNNFAELMGLIHGLWNNCMFGWTRVEIELDSWLVIHWLKTQRYSLWYMKDYWDEIQNRLVGLSFSISHACRESNDAADGLAKRGAQGCTESWFSASYLPSVIRGTIRLDKGACLIFRNVGILDIEVARVFVCIGFCHRLFTLLIGFMASSFLFLF